MGTQLAEISHIYARETKADADTAKVLTINEARRMTSSIAKPQLLER